MVEEGAVSEQFVSLYRRFRPGRFDELRGQEHVARALKGAVRDGRVAHAYLFSGPRGTGKTSAARILAKALNCHQPLDGEPCGVCRSCLEITKGASLDVFELDAASNNGVEAMRDLVSTAALATPGAYKVYIVDEVHMLSNAAANALLKTLEEPPARVVFVLATTDPQKVPSTIISRTQHFEFRLLGADVLDQLVRDVRDAAGLELADDDLAVAVRRGRGSARDTLSFLDQVAASGSADDVRPELVTLVEAIAAADGSATLVAVAELTAAGWAPGQLTAELIDELRQVFLLNLAPNLATVAGADAARLTTIGTDMGLARLVRTIEVLGQALVQMREAPDARVVLEMSLIGVTLPELGAGSAELAERVSILERAVARLSAPAAPGPMSAPSVADAERPSLGALRRTRPVSSTVPNAPAEPVEVTAAEAAPPVESGPLPDRDALVEAWGDHVVKTLTPKTKALLGSGRFIDSDGSSARYALPNQATRDRCEPVRGQVEAALAAHFGRPIHFELVVDAARPPEVSDDMEYEADDTGEVVDESVEAKLLQAFPGALEVTE